ncbi:MAG: hypothetical protein Q4C13_05910 [Clostridia bacterium]|nr:hypothetical protein [Clostridia bacterium]
MKKLRAALGVLTLACMLLAGCKAAVPAVVPASGFVSPANAASPGNYASPGNFVSPGDAGLSAASAADTGVDLSAYPMLTQALVDEVLAAFFPADTRYFCFAAEEGGENQWLEKPLLTEQSDSSGEYDVMEAKALQDGVVYDTWAFQDRAGAGFHFGIYGRNEMSEAEAARLEPSDGIAWMSLMQGINGARETITEAAEAEAAIPRDEAVEQAAALLQAIGIDLPGEPAEVLPTFRVRGMYEGAEEDGAEAFREYGWLVRFHPMPYETIQVGVTAAGYGQFWWDIDFS